jgi:hypothetical protein
MSYCRWSSDGFGCDVYVYEDVSGGFTCHVASRKIVNLHEAPHCPSFFDYPTDKDGKISDESVSDFVGKHHIYMEWLREKAIREPIGLEWDGKSFNVETATSMGNELSILKEMGYSVPQYAIDALLEEGKENGEQATEDFLK